MISAGDPVYKAVMNTWQEVNCGKMDKYTLGYCQKFVDLFVTVARDNSVNGIQSNPSSNSVHEGAQGKSIA